MRHGEPLESRRPLAADAAATIPDPGVLTVFGDRDRTHFDDLIVVQPSSTDASLLEVVVNGDTVATRSTVGLRRIVIAGGRGDDTIRIDVPRLAVGCTIRGGPGNDTIEGGPRGDRINGGDGDDTIDGGGGNDEIVGGGGNDYLLGNAGADRIVGGDGDDTIDGGLGNDMLLGGDGSDTIDGEAGLDVIRGDDGDDTLLGGSGRDRLFAGLGADRLFGSCSLDTMVCDPADTVTETALANPLVVAASDAAIRQWLVGQATRRRHEAAFGPMAFGVGRVNSPTPVAGTAPTTAASGSDFSSTNTQVNGVDEADTVLTDGRHLYAVIRDELLVIDADPTSLAVVSRMPLEGHEHTLYLDGDRLTVISQITRWPEIVPFPNVRIGIVPWGPVEQHVKVTVLDIANRSAPTVVEETLVDGSLTASRSVGNSVYLVMQNTPEIRPMPFIGGRRGLESTAEFRSRIAAIDLWSLLPVARTTTFGPDGRAAASPITQPLVEPGSLYLPVRGGGNDIVSIVSFSPAGATPGIDHAVSTLGVAGTVYASPDSIILAATDPGIWWGSQEGTTTLHEFSLAGAMPYVAGGTVSGRLLDQFSIDAHADGTIRVVTQTGWGDDASTNLFVLDHENESLETIGSVGGIGQGEDTRSVRFVDDTAYIVTFRQVDPLFVIDLANPTKPSVVGELTIPGFSSYLHPVDGTHLIGIGVGDSFGQVKLSLFDVSAPASPTEVSALRFGGGTTYASSAAQWDHHAFSYFADRRVVAIPVTRWTYDPASGESRETDALAVYAVDLAGGFRELAQIADRSPIGRSLRIGDRLYAVSDAAVTLVDFSDPTTVIATLPLD